MEYTSSQVWRLLQEGSEDEDELIDLTLALTKLAVGKQKFLLLIQSGYRVGEAMGRSGLIGNQTRLKREVLRELVFFMNGGSHVQEEAAVEEQRRIQAGSPAGC